MCKFACSNLAMFDNSPYFALSLMVSEIMPNLNKCSKLYLSLPLSHVKLQSEADGEWNPDEVKTNISPGDIVNTHICGGHFIYALSPH